MNGRFSVPPSASNVARISSCDLTLTRSPDRRPPAAPTGVRRSAVDVLDVLDVMTLLKL
jgi:hypothetical protein